MKRFTPRDIKFLISAAAVFLLISLVSFGMKTVIPGNQLPAEIRSYLDQHFPGYEVKHAIREKDGIRISYHVNVNGEFNLEFNRKFEVIDVEGMSRLPEHIVPEAIQKYVSVNYPQNFITDWEKDGKKQEIELDNGLDLSFNSAGVFIGIDR